MKKNFAILILILSASTILSGQDPRKTTYNPGSGYVTINELNYGTGMGSLSYYGNYFFGVTTMHGYQLNIYNLNTDINLIAGGATGFLAYEDYTVVPLYLDFRFVNNFRKWGPFAYLQTGMLIHTSDFEYGSKMFVTPGFGAKYNVSPKVAVDFATGLHVQMADGVYRDTYVAFRAGIIYKPKYFKRSLKSDDSQGPTGQRIRKSKH